jgi:hypothetical protein
MSAIMDAGLLGYHGGDLTTLADRPCLAVRMALSEPVAGSRQLVEQRLGVFQSAVSKPSVNEL